MVFPVFTFDPATVFERVNAEHFLPHHISPSKKIIRGLIFQYDPFQGIPLTFIVKYYNGTKSQLIHSPGLYI